MKIKPLDFVRLLENPTKIGMITEISSYETKDNPEYLKASVHWIGEGSSAWHGEDTLIVIDSLPYILAKEMVHPFSSKGKQYARKSFEKRY